MTAGCDTLVPCVRSSSPSGSDLRNCAKSRCPNRARAKWSSGSRRPGACHSDLHIMDVPAGFMPFTPPFTLGHETTGHVAGFGPGVDRWRPGDAVAVYGPWGCGSVPAVPPVGGELLRARERDRRCRRRARARRRHGRVPARPLRLVCSCPLGDLDPVEAAPLGDAALTPYHAIARGPRVARPRHDGGRDRDRWSRPHGRADPARAHAGARSSRSTPQTRKLELARGRCGRRVERGRRRRVTRQGRDQRQRCRARRRLRRGRRDVGDRVGFGADRRRRDDRRHGPGHVAGQLRHGSVRGVGADHVLGVAVGAHRGPRARARGEAARPRGAVQPRRRRACVPATARRARSTAAPSSFRRWPNTPRSGRATSCCPTAARCASARSVRTTSVASSGSTNGSATNRCTCGSSRRCPRRRRRTSSGSRRSTTTRTWRSSPSSATRSSPSPATTAPVTTRPRSRSRVQDDQQGRGLGTLLLEHLAVVARVERHHDVQRRHAAEQPRMLNVFADAGWDANRHFDGRHGARAVLDRADRRFDRGDRGTRAPRRSGVDGAHARAAFDRGHRREPSRGHDRPRAVPQPARVRLPGPGVPGEPDLRVGRGRARLPERPRRSRRGRPRGRRRAGRPSVPDVVDECAAEARARPRDHLGRVRRGRTERQGRRARASSRPRAATACASSGRTASAS